MLYRSINPKNNKLLKTFETISASDLQKKIQLAHSLSESNLGAGLAQSRFDKCAHLCQIMADSREETARMIVDEMGKPIAQARGEIDKSIAHINYYAKNARQFLADERIDMMHGGKGLISVEPLGPTLSKQVQLLIVLKSSCPGTFLCG
jgi:succinate-semialdehyde dehydrogenase/glutarate-semialdehyde dehydrogenase